MSKQSELKRYFKYLEMKEDEWESLCVRCGGCCGAYDEPCEHLKKTSKNKFYCQVYTNRLGTRKAVSGEEFDCVAVKKILHTRWKKDYLCGCKKYLKMPLKRVCK